jgi:hypothetical protein
MQFQIIYNYCFDTAESLGEIGHGQALVYEIGHINKLFDDINVHQLDDLMYTKYDRESWLELSSEVLL